MKLHTLKCIGADKCFIVQQEQINAITEERPVEHLMLARLSQ